jgi:hypothetical protein
MTTWILILLGLLVLGDLFILRALGECIQRLHRIDQERKRA